MPKDNADDPGMFRGEDFSSDPVDPSDPLRHGSEGGTVPPSERQMMWLDIAAVVAASVVGMAVGALWFSRAVLGPRWAGAAGVTLGAAPGAAYALAFVATLVTAAVLHAAASVVWQALGGSFLVVALGVAVVGWVGFTAARVAVEYLFEQRPGRLYAIDMGHQLAVVVAMGLVIGLVGLIGR